MLYREHKKSGDQRAVDQIKILVAEDDKFNQFLIRHILGSKGYNFTIVSNGMEVLERVNEQAFDVVLMDINMPGMDGVTATKMIRGLDKKERSAIPIIALTASIMSADAKRCLDNGMNGYITKPYTEEKLLEAIANVMTVLNDGSHSDAADNVDADIVINDAKQKKYYDLSFIDSICNGDKEFEREVIMIFQETIPVLLDKLIGAGMDKRSDLISQIAHQMKPNLELLGIHSVKDMMAELETADLPLSKSDIYLEKVSSILRGVFAQLDEHLSRSVVLAVK